MVIEPIDGLVFCPWKGPRYVDPIFGIRILVMGESTYLGPHESCDLDYAHDHPSERWPRSADAPRV